MRDKHKEQVIQTAIQEYRDSCCFGFGSRTAHTISMMEEAYYMCSLYNIRGITALKQTIDEAKDKWKKELAKE